MAKTLRLLTPRLKTFYRSQTFGNWWQRFMSASPRLTPPKGDAITGGDLSSRGEISGAGMSIAFHRTLRVPDDGRSYELPAVRVF